MAVLLAESTLLWAKLGDLIRLLSGPKSQHLGNFASVERLKKTMEIPQKSTFGPLRKHWATFYSKN